MKKLLLALAILFSTVANSQQLTSCMGIEFGDSKQTVMTKMNSKPEFEFYKENSASSTVSYTGGKFAGRQCVGAVFHFYDNQTHTITILIDPGQNIKVMDVYKEVIAELKDKYMVEPFQSHKYQSPYSEGDGYTTSAIKLGYAEIATYFTFPDENAILVEVTQSLSIKVQYQHTKLARLFYEGKNKQRTNDY